MMLKAVAIDDEPIALEVIKNLAAQVPFIDLKACFTNPLQAITYLQQEQVQLLFLDIQMPGIPGTDLIKSITNPPMVIFTTAYSEHAVQGFELNAVDYLLKPFSLSRFLKACNKAYEQHDLRRSTTSQQETSKTFFVKAGYEDKRVDPEEIMYLESTGNYVKFILTAGSLTSRMTMMEAEALLPAAAFMRVHRSFIVAIKRISRADKKSVWLDEKELPIGAAYYAAIAAFIARNKKV